MIWLVRNTSRGELEHFLPANHEIVGAVSDKQFVVSGDGPTNALIPAYMLMRIDVQQIQPDDPRVLALGREVVDADDVSA